MILFCFLAVYDQFFEKSFLCRSPMYFVKFFDALRGKHTKLQKCVSASRANTPAAFAPQMLLVCEGRDDLFEARIALRLPFLAELLESRVRAKGIPERVEPKKSRRNRRFEVKPTIVWHL